MAYLPDCDLSKTDKGPAGILITNQHIIYHIREKHHNMWLHDEGELLVMKDGDRFDVLYREDKRGRPKRRLARLTTGDARKLIHALDELQCNLRVVRARKRQ